MSYQTEGSDSGTTYFLSGLVPGSIIIGERFCLFDVTIPLSMHVSCSLVGWLKERRSPVPSFGNSLIFASMLVAQVLLMFALG